ncbi:MAG: hypothetical protein H7329_01095, partial [Opitutaceae bacterium]|nr:hypothetical protein [Cytophagales bacterium]
MHWLTADSSNLRFHAKVEGLGQKFFISQFGKLYAINIPQVPLMSEALEQQVYRNGDVIPNVTGNNLCDSLKTGGYCYYNNSATNNNIYGKLYNWYTVLDARGLAPAG